jgi:serine/threonine protein kinase/ribosomal protein L40E
MTVVGKPPVDDRICPRCGARRAVDAASTSLCPSCLFATALGDDDEQDDTDADMAPPFDIVTILARDAEAVTYLARGFAASEHVALKIVETREAAAIASRIHTWKTRLIAVRHPGISRLVDAGRAGRSRVYLATEYASGPALDYQLRHGTLSAAERIEIVRQAVDALAVIHAQGLAHMRVGPSRIKLTMSGGVRVTLLGLGAGLIVGGLTPEPALDVRALVELCSLLGIPVDAPESATIASLRAALQDAVA